MQYVEDILETDLVSNLKYIYNKNNDGQTMLIFFLRSHIYYEKDNPSNDQYISFLLKELNLPREIVYHNVKISQRLYENNSLQNIMDNFIYRYLDTYLDDPIRGRILGRELIHIYYKRYLEGIQRRFKNRKTKIRFYEYISKYCILSELYNDFNLSLQPIKRFEGFEYPSYHNDFTLSFDETCQRYYNEFIQNEEKILEKDLEDYIFRNGLEDIKIINRQLKVQSGIIDLLGMDSKGRKVVIELKVTTRPRDLIWQLQAYTSDLRNSYQELRTMVVAPKLDDSILNQIPKEYEVYEFSKLRNSYKFKKVQ